MSKSSLFLEEAGPLLSHSTVPLDNKIPAQNNPLQSVNGETKAPGAEIEKVAVGLADSKNSDFYFEMHLQLTYFNMMSRQLRIKEINDRLTSLDPMNHQSSMEIRQKLRQMHQEVILDLYSLYEMSCTVFPALNRTLADFFKATPLPTPAIALTKNPLTASPTTLRGDESLRSGDLPVPSHTPLTPAFSTVSSPPDQNIFFSVALAREAGIFKKPLPKRKRATAPKRSAPYRERPFSNPYRPSKPEPIPSTLSTDSLFTPVAASHDEEGYTLSSPATALSPWGEVIPDFEF